MPELADLIFIYLIVFTLKIFHVPGVREIEWKWFLLAPIIYAFIRLVWPVISFVIYLAITLALVYSMAVVGLWVMG